MIDLAKEREGRYRQAPPPAPFVPPPFTPRNERMTLAERKAEADATLPAMYYRDPGHSLGKTVW